MEKPRIRMIFMGKNKGPVFESLQRVIGLGIEVVAVVMSVNDKQHLSGVLGLPVYSDKDIYDHLAGTKIPNLNLENIDVVVSYLFPKKIKKPIIHLSRLGCINFHSAPLPEYRGWGVYNAAILNNEQHWGVSAHFVDEEFDTGDLIKVNRFTIDTKKETAFSLDHHSQKYLLDLFGEVINMVICGEPFPRKHQERDAGTTYYSKQETLKHERVDLGDSTDVINSKIQAFWHPPFAAKILINGKEYFLINSEIMGDIAKRHSNILS